MPRYASQFYEKKGLRLLAGFLPKGLLSAGILQTAFLPTELLLAGDSKCAPSTPGRNQ